MWEQDQSSIDFSIKKNMPSLPLSQPFLPPSITPPFSHLPLRRTSPLCPPENSPEKVLSSDEWGAAFSPVKLQWKEKVDGVSAVRVSDRREMCALASVSASNLTREAIKLASLLIMRIICPSISNTELAVLQAVKTD